MASAQKIEERRTLIKNYLLQQPKKTQGDIGTYLEQICDVKASQTTIQNDLEELGFQKTDNGYKLITPIAGLGLEEQLLTEIFAFDLPRIITSPLHAVSIIVNKGTASKVAEIINSKYGDMITGTLNSDKLVLVLTAKEETAKEIGNTLFGIKDDALKTIKPSEPKTRKVKMINLRDE